jgi:hypothetical protein
MPTGSIAAAYSVDADQSPDIRSLEIEITSHHKNEVPLEYRHAGDCMLCISNPGHNIREIDQ